MEQGWYDLLFAHWPVSVRHLRQLVPPQLELETYDGSAWVSLTPFQLHLRPRGLSFAGSLWKFPELNCRTYVRYGEIPGIYFFSLDAASLLAVLGAHLLFHLPYFQSAMEIRKKNGTIAYASIRLKNQASFQAQYAASHSGSHPAKGTLEYWLTERYCLYTIVRGQVCRAEIHHRPWLLYPATAEIQQNSIGTVTGIKLEEKPALLQYSPAQEVLIWPLQQAGTQITGRRGIS